MSKTAKMCPECGFDHGDEQRPDERLILLAVCRNKLAERARRIRNHCERRPRDTLARAILAELEK